MSKEKFISKKLKRKTRIRNMVCIG